MTTVAGAAQIVGWLKADPVRWGLLEHVRDLRLPDCWIAAGFVRNMVWNILHHRRAELSGDVDVIWFDRSDAGEALDRDLEARLRRLAPDIDWSVKNQARMHGRNGDAPYACAEDAMRFWPETATTIAVRRTAGDGCDLIAPFGLDDLLTLTLRPAGAFAGAKRPIFDSRLREKRWMLDFPELRLADRVLTPPPPAWPSPAPPRSP